MLFVALNLVDFVIIALFFPETKGKFSGIFAQKHLLTSPTGKTLEEMNAVFGDEIDTRNGVYNKSSHDEKESIEAVNP